MIFLSGLNIGLMGFFGCRKAAKGNCPFVRSNLCFVRAFFEPSVIRNSLKPRSVMRDAICAILAVGRFAQIYQTIIVSFPVYMIQLILGPSSRGVQPRKAVFSVSLPVNFNGAIPSVMPVSSSITNANSGSRYAPCKHAGIGIVVQQFAQLFGRDHTSFYPVGFEIANGGSA